MTFGVRLGSGGSPLRWLSSRRWYRRGPGTAYRRLKSIQFLVSRDRRAVLAFLRASYPLSLPLSRRLRLLLDIIRATNAIRGYHTLEEILTVSDRIFARAGRSDLVVLEAGTGFGASTVKLSLVVRAAGGRLLIYDSFRGIPANDERHQLLDGTVLSFREGAFHGKLAAVQRRLARYGAPEVCAFEKGLFEETLPRLTQTVDVAVLDVDLIASTRTAIRHVFPRLRADGVLFSQDGHLRATVELLSDPAFWRSEVGVVPPVIAGLGRLKLLEIRATPRL